MPLGMSCRKGGLCSDVGDQRRGQHRQWISRLVYSIGVQLHLPLGQMFVSARALAELAVALHNCRPRGLHAPWYHSSNMCGPMERRQWPSSALVTMSVPSILTDWSDKLCEFGFPGDAGRRDAAAQLLRENEFMSMRSLQDADHPREWVGAECLAADELEFLSELRVRKRSRSR